MNSVHNGIQLCISDFFNLWNYVQHRLQLVAVNLHRSSSVLCCVVSLPWWAGFALWCVHS